MYSSYYTPPRYGLSGGPVVLGGEGGPDPAYAAQPMLYQPAQSAAGAQYLQGVSDLLGVSGAGAGQQPAANRAAQIRQVKKQAAAFAREQQAKQRQALSISQTSTKTGLYVVGVIGMIILYFVYYDVLAQNTMLFGTLVIIICVALFWHMGSRIKEEGVLAAGAFQM